MITTIGALGSAILLMYFILDETHKVNSDSVSYNLGNLCGATLLLIYAYLLGSIPFMVLNAVWAAFALKKLLST